MSTAQISINLENDLVCQAERVLSQLGLSTTEFMRMSLKQLVAHKNLPFEDKIPNQDTINALEEDISNYPRYTAGEIEGLFEKL